MKSRKTYLKISVRLAHIIAAFVLVLLVMPEVSAKSQIVHDAEYTRMEKQFRDWGTTFS